MAKRGRADSELVLMPLGGMGEIGMNCLVVETLGRLLLIDCGAMFPSTELGVDIIHPGFEYLTERRDAIEALVLTHAHEDHIAGAPFLLREVDVPVYGASYSLGLLERKMKDFSASPKLDANEFSPGAKVALGPFAIRSFPMPHSIVENTGLVVDMPAGRLLHTGDFKLRSLSSEKGEDVLGELAAVAEGKVDLMLADSTGSEENNESGEESHVAAALDALVRESTGRVFVAIFSSNIYRLDALFQIARRHGRGVSLCGRSVHNHFEVASNTGNLRVPPGLIVPLDEASDLAGERSLIVVSGTQGEMHSALGRLANDSHHALRVERGDTVILSSRFIPGNELAIGRVIDKLLRLGARVVHRSVRNDVHVSGHGSRTEIKRAVEAVSPRCFVPVHGTYRHLAACADLAREANVSDIAIISDGDRVSCGPDGLTVRLGDVPTRRVFIEGQSGMNEGVVRDRVILGSHGVLLVTLAMDAAEGVLASMDIVARGVIQDEVLPWLSESIRETVRQTVDELSQDDRANRGRCAEIVRSALRKDIRKKVSREPYVLVSILDAQAENPVKDR